MEVLKTIEKIIETPFIEDEFEAGSVCFANDEDLRADFKLQFRIYDVMNYVYGVLISCIGKKIKNWNLFCF
ncbi:hypothetical protein EOD40_13470 [Flavobacterium sufflavum]|uniref:Uncharacterized protein n=1 Tax=Flavobacterium sufflavum TaxID=1921138 RepID=A0A437KQB5_9FLAO|nr:hypothetical protein [Flavobacterium sufflavum]RVT73922.1 hypothetical protein EOD40_13470 [Flavobacterium sufflavum]